MSAEPIRIPVPVESPSVVFDVVGRGYDRRQVHEQLHRQEQELAELRWELEALQAERDSVREDRARLDAARADFQRVRAAWRPSYDEFSRRLERVLALAEEQAAEIVAAAQRTAQQTVAAAEAEVAQIRDGIAAQAAELRQVAAAEHAADRERGRRPVSYTHLTLPTILRV